MKKIISPIVLFCFTSFFTAEAQTPSDIHLTLNWSRGLSVAREVSFGTDQGFLTREYPLFTVRLGDSLISSLQMDCRRERDGIRFSLNNRLEGAVRVDPDFQRGWKALVSFSNPGDSVLILADFVPLGQSPEHLYISASGPWSLARTKIFRPGLGPVGVILPDNAWELGYSDLPLSGERSLCALSRRVEGEKMRKERWRTLIEPGGRIDYVIYADTYSGPWQEGLRLMFQKRWLYDLDEFDDTMFQRPDLAWIRHRYTITLQFAWDHQYYDASRGGSRIEEYLDLGKRLFGGWDVLGLWPTWPTLGTDDRNQWDLYRDLPGGYAGLRSLAGELHDRGSRFFVAYNPWDQSTRQEDPYRGLARLIKATGADGVVLDCRGSSSRQLQRAADSVRAGVIMYSEGMAVPADMPLIVAGRVHDAIFMPPPLNLNKLIKPDFAIFRVCQLSQGRLHREFAVSFFNGYGIEMNVFAPGRPEWIETEYRYWGRLVRILRENTDTFISSAWTPLISTRKDSIWVNRWPGEGKTLYTVYSLIPEGFNGPLFPVEKGEEGHYISLYRHEEIRPDTIAGTPYLPVGTNAFNRNWLGTRREGNVDCIARLPRLLNVSLKGDSLFFSAAGGDSIRVWAGDPSYQAAHGSFAAGSHRIKLMQRFPRREGKFVIQLFEGNCLLDERVVTMKPGTPRLISRMERTKPARRTPSGMALIPGGSYLFKTEPPDNFIPYPDHSAGDTLMMRPFYMDIYPVTNRQYADFLRKSGYVPADTVNFLKHWRHGSYPSGEADHPVVYVNLDDARAYARWAGKRLPTEAEWQYSGQGGDGRAWPWGAEMDSSRCNAGLDRITAVTRFPGGASPFGVNDLVGNVWQLTGDVYDNCSHSYIIIKGGSYYNPTSSWWYVQGGPQPLPHTQMLLRVSPSFERNGTVGFRCVKDAR